MCNTRAHVDGEMKVKLFLGFNAVEFDAQLISELFIEHDSTWFHHIVNEMSPVTLF